MSVGDKFRDSIAFARCVLRDDWDGMESLLTLNPDPLDLLIPQSWILNAAVHRLATELGMTVDETWVVMLDSVEQVNDGMDEDDEEQ